MRLSPPPAAASWIHRDSRAGFEIAFFVAQSAGTRLLGHTTAAEGSSPWSVGYDIDVDDTWVTRRVSATSITVEGPHELRLLRDDKGRWTVDGERRPDLDGCVDIDFESSAMTNTLPIHRLDFVPSVPRDVPAAFVRAADLRVERLEQRYTLVGTTSDGFAFHYESATFDFACDLRYDRTGLIVDYPGIATRNA